MTHYLKYNGGESHLQNVTVSLSGLCCKMFNTVILSFSLKEEKKLVLSFIIVVIILLLFYLFFIIIIVFSIVPFFIEATFCKISKFPSGH